MSSFVTVDRLTCIRFSSDLEVVVLVVVVVGGCDGFRSRSLLFFQAIDVLRKYVVAVVVVVGVLLLLLFVSLFLCLFLNSCECFFLWRLFVRGECWCRSRSFLFCDNKIPTQTKKGEPH